MFKDSLMSTEQDRKQQPFDGIIFNYISFLFKRKKSIFYKLIFVSIIAVTYTLTLPDVYRSSATLTAKGDDGISSSSIAGALGQFAGLGGISVGSDILSTKDKAIASMESYTFFESIYTNEQFAVNLLAVDGFNEKNTTIDPNKYNKSKSTWVVDKIHPQIAYDKYRKALSINNDPFKPIFTVSISSLSPYAANEMISFVLDEINEYTKYKDIAESKKAIEYLNNEIKKSAIPDIRSALSSMVIQYMANLVTSEKSDQYLFDIIEMPYASIEKSDPKRAIICIQIFLIALFAELAYLFLSFLFNVSLRFSLKKGFTLKKI